MPIRPELRHLYGAQWKNVTRPRILERAGGKFDANGRYIGGAKCEQCGKPDRETVFVYDGGESGQYWTLKLTPIMAQRWKYCLLGGSGNFTLFARQLHLARKIRVVLTIAHLNHVAGDDRDENLKALCQWCHLHHDQVQHHETRAARKDSSRPLLREAC